MLISPKMFMLLSCLVLLSSAYGLRRRLPMQCGLVVLLSCEIGAIRASKSKAKITVSFRAPHF